MSIWGKLLAGTFGFALGGPIGAMLGVIAGHSCLLYTSDAADDL